MGVAFGGAEVGVAEERLDVADVGAAFEEVGGKGVAETMDRDFFGDFGATDGFVENVLGGSYRERAAWGLTGEKEALDTVKGAIFGDKAGDFF